MSSEDSSNSPEAGGDAILPDGPADAAADQEIEPANSEDEYAFLYDDSQIPRSKLRSSDEESFQPSEPDEDVDGNLEGQHESSQETQLLLIKPESEDEEMPLANRPISSPSLWSPAKRRAADLALGERAFKRAKGAFNREYLHLLNVDIEDAAAQYVPHDEGELPPTQVGLTCWTSVEKELFFTALSRLGRDNVPGIARRIRTKGELEVRQYLRLLEDAVAARKRKYQLEPLYPQDFPAAVEIGPQCNAALEEAGDAIASKQEHHEESAEEMRWDDDWLITPFTYKSLEKEAPPNMPSLQLFRVSSWLELSERLFMNANYPENNWQYVSDDNPSIRTTALEDFYSLAVSITKRLVAATIFVSEARARAKRDIDPQDRDRVWPKDVEAAALSLGLKTENKAFWAGCARRLRIDVFNNDEADDDDNPGSIDADGTTGERAHQEKDEDEDEPMTYDEVEAALGVVGDERNTQAESEDMESDEFASLSDTPSLDDLSDLDERPADPALQPGPEPEPQDEPIMDIDENNVQRETKELLLYTAMPYPLTTRTRRAVEGRIRAELDHVTYADAVDTKASQREEKRLWYMLGRNPTDETDRIKLPDQAPRRAMHTVDDMTLSGADWRDKLKYVSEWTQSLPRKRTIEEGRAER